jgi:hypothetical protein
MKRCSVVWGCDVCFRVAEWRKKRSFLWIIGLNLLGCDQIREGLFGGVCALGSECGMEVEKLAQGFGFWCLGQVTECRCERKTL